MSRRPPRSTRTDTLFPYTTLFRSGVHRNMEAMTEDLRRAMKLPDAGRPIDPEAARAAIRTMQGVRSVAWLDRSNLLVRVTGAEFRSYRFIDQVCQQLEP